MEFRPCIDIHNGKVKQIVGSSLQNEGDVARENFTAEHNASYYAKLYEKYGLSGGHIILLNGKNSPYYEETKKQALEALKATPGRLQVGGGITAENAEEFLEAGASHVIVTSYVFQDGKIQIGNLEKISSLVKPEHLVLDLSCRKKDNLYYIVTDRWQKYTNISLNYDILERLSKYCDEFLIHAVDVEGKAEGIEDALAELLGKWGKIPITYAGGVHDMEDLRKLKEIGRGHIHVTVGSALDLFGGSMKLEDVLAYIKGNEGYR